MRTHNRAAFRLMAGGTAEQETGEMKRLHVAHSVHTGFVAAVLFAGLSLAPSVSWAGRGNQDRDKGDSKQQEKAARGNQAVKDATPAVRLEQGRLAGREQAPAGNAAPQRNASPPARSRQERTPVSRWEIRPTAPNNGQQQAPGAVRQSPGYMRQQPAPEAQTPYQPPQASTPRGNAWGRQTGGDQGVQTPYQPPRASTPRGNAWGRQTDGEQQGNGNQTYRVPRRASTPQASDNGGTRGFDQPRLDRGTGFDQNPYQLYRPAKRAATPNASVRGGATRGDRATAPENGAVVRKNRGNTSGQQPGTVQRGPQDMPKLNRPGAGNRTPQATRGAGGKNPGGAVGRPTAPTADRAFRVPQATFRGPGSDQLVRTVPKGDSVRLQTRMRDRIRQENQQFGNWDAKGRMTHDVVGNRVPPEAVVFNRTNVVNNNVTINYTNIVNNYGTPRFGFVFAPRFYGDFGHHRHHTVIVVNFFYPYYYSDPYFVGFWYPGYYPAVYSFYGWTPAWVYPTRVYYTPSEYYYTPPATPYRYYTDYGLDYASADRAISDIRQAWLNSDIGSLTGHLTDQLDVRVYFDGEYSYTTTTDDFYQMTLDTLTTTQTVEMDFDNPIWISSHEVFVTGRQVFYDPDGDRHEVYVSFRLRQLGSGWYLVAIGSSLSPIQHQYTDFRYNN